MADRSERDVAEGRYTQADPEGPETRTVAGRYTRSEDDPLADDTIVGAYVGSEREGDEPLVRDARTRRGNYTRTQK
jgi:hypothetical protein